MSVRTMTRWPTSRSRRPSDGLGFVYFIEREPGDYVKIGWAKNGPYARIPELQTGSPDLLIVRAYFEGSLEDERRMHHTFANLRGRGEWFANILKLAEFLNYFEEIDATRAVSPWELAAALHDCVLVGSWHPEYPVSEVVYEESGDWQQWKHLLHEHALAGDE